MAVSVRATASKNGFSSVETEITMKSESGLFQEDCFNDNVSKALNLL